MMQRVKRETDREEIIIREAQEEGRLAFPGPSAAQRDGRREGGKARSPTAELPMRRSLRLLGYGRSGGVSSGGVACADMVRGARCAVRGARARLE